MQLKHNDALRLATALTVGLLLAGCTSQSKTAEAPPAKKQETAQKDEYVRVNSLGSWIPKKVKKGTVPQNDGSVMDVDPEALDKINETGRTRGPKQ